MSSDQNTSAPSTLGSYVNSGIAVAQSALGSLTGSTADKAQAEQKKTEADAEYAASHAGVKAGPFSLSSSGAAVKDNEDRTQGQWDQTLGSTKEAVGNLIGNQSLKQSGREQNERGQAQEAKGQLTDLGQGLQDRVTGSVGAAVAGLTGDREAQAKYADQHDEGKTRQRGVEMDLDQQAAAAAERK